MHSERAKGMRRFKSFQFLRPADFLFTTFSFFLFFSILTDNFVETAQFGDRNVLLLLLMIFLYVPES